VGEADTKDQGGFTVWPPAGLGAQGSHHQGKQQQQQQQQ
jgi:hypothetical protein